MKTVTKTSMVFSVYARNNLGWQLVELNSSFKNITPPESRIVSITKAKIKNNLSSSPTHWKSPAGFISKRNTCFAYTILLALSVIYTITLENFFCKVCTFVTITEVNNTKYGYQEKSALLVDPSNFLWALKDKILSTSSAPFWFNSGCHRNSASSFWWIKRNINKNWWFAL